MNWKEVDFKFLCDSIKYKQPFPEQAEDQTPWSDRVLLLVLGGGGISSFLLLLHLVSSLSLFQTEMIDINQEKSCFVVRIDRLTGFC